MRVLLILILFLMPYVVNATSATPVIPNIKLLSPIPLDCTMGANACKYPLAAGMTAISFVKMDGTATVAEIDAPNGYTIMGLPAHFLDVQGQMLHLILIGTTWYKF